MNEFEPLDQKCSLNADNIDFKIRTFSFIRLCLGKEFSSLVLSFSIWWNQKGFNSEFFRWEESRFFFEIIIFWVKFCYWWASSYDLNLVVWFCFQVVISCRFNSYSYCLCSRLKLYIQDSLVLQPHPLTHLLIACKLMPESIRSLFTVLWIFLGSIWL